MRTSVSAVYEDNRWIREVSGFFENKLILTQRMVS